MNDTRKFYGPTPLRIGLIKSRNLVNEAVFPHDLGAMLSAGGIHVGSVVAVLSLRSVNKVF